MPISVLQYESNQPSFSAEAILENCSSAVCRSSAISWAGTSGSGKFSLSSRESSLSQKMSSSAVDFQERLDVLDEIELFVLGAL